MKSNGEINFEKPESYSPLTLAYLGDAVFELKVRSHLVAKANMPVNQLNKKAKSFVKAQAQAQMYHRLEELLTEEEMAVMKRGRNAKSHTSAKNASINDYRHATGVEALFGYLFIKGDEERISELFGLIISIEF